MKPSHFSSTLREVLLSTFLVLTFTIFVTFLYYSDIYYSLLGQANDLHPVTNYVISTPHEITIERLPFAVGAGDKNCNIFEGRWVHDDTLPLYEESECKYITEDLTCLKHGRPDKDYMKWRWQPHGCYIPSFNSTLMLESLRGKTMLFTGDSLNRNQFFSLICLLQKNLPENDTSLEFFTNFESVFTVKDYNVRIEFIWAPFLWESNSDDPFKHRVPNKIVRNNSINTHGKHWKDADIIVFNTYLWWSNYFKLLRGSFEDPVKDIIKIPNDNGYRMVLRDLVKWIKENIDPKKKRILFAGMSPDHRKIMDQYGDPEGGSCYKETTMIQDPTHFQGKKSFMKILDEELSKSTVPIIFLNITQLSSTRKDAHNTIYRKHWVPLTPKELANPKKYADCIHWCLPGVPDTWNELLFAKLLYP